MSALSDFLYHRFDKAVSDMGLYIVDIDVVPHAKNYDIAFYIDRPASGVSLDDCETVSRFVSAELDADTEFDALLGSSARELRYFKGRKVEIKLKKPVEKDYNIVAELVDTKVADEDAVTSLVVRLKDKSETIEIGWTDVKLIKLLFEVKG
jgi:ribosome maturation factor RimP